jgi:hypothetical protein
MIVAPMMLPLFVDEQIAVREDGKRLLGWVLRDGRVWSCARAGDDVAEGEFRSQDEAVSALISWDHEPKVRR